MNGNKINSIEGRRDEVKHWRARQVRRFPLHVCELPMTPDRIFPRVPVVATCQQRLKHWMLHMLVAWRRNPSVRNMRPSTYSIDREQAVHVRSREWWLIHPMSRFWMIWQLVVIVHNMLLIVLLPFLIAFTVSGAILHLKNPEKYPYVSWTDMTNPVSKAYIEKSKKIRDVISKILDANQFIFMFHMAFKFVTGYYDMQHNLVVMNQRMILKRHMIHSSSVFQGVPKSLVNKICSHLIEDIYLQFDVVYSSGSEAAYLYFLSIGTVAVYLSTGEEITHLMDGDFFGLISLVLEAQNKYHLESIVALETCRILKLPRRYFVELIQPTVRLFNRLRAIAFVRAEDLNIYSEDEIHTNVDDNEFAMGAKQIFLSDESSDDTSESSSADSALAARMSLGLQRHPI